MMMYANHADTVAFEELLRRYRNQVYGFLMRSTRDRSLAEDLYQETFMRVVRSAASYRPRAAFRTWLFTIVRNLLIDAGRRRKSHGTPVSLTSREGGDQSDEIPDTRRETDPFHGESSREIRSAILEILQAMPEEQREIFLLREEAGLTFREAARVAGCTENTAKSRMRYALLKLREELTARGIYPGGTTVTS